MRPSLIPALALALFTTSAAQAIPLFSDNFNGEAQALNTSLDNWTVSDGTIDVIGTGFFDFYPGNGNYLDLDGSSGNAGKITTNSSFSFLAGTYTLRFDLGGSTRGDSNTMTVALGSFFSETFTLPSSAPLQTITRTFTFGSSNGTGALSFDHTGGDNLGLILDNVLLDFRAPTTVPEPSTLALLSLAGLLGLRRRR